MAELEFFDNNFTEKQKEIYEYMRKMLIGLTYREANDILTHLIHNLGRKSIVQDDQQNENP